MKYGDRPPDNETWFRLITDSKFIRQERIHHSAFKGRALTPPKEGDWLTELSGALLSLTPSTLDAANERVKEIKESQAADDVKRRTGPHGCMAAQCGSIRKANYDVVFTPNENPAHADLVSFKLPPEQLLSEIDKLLSTLTYIDGSRFHDHKAIAEAA